MSGRHAKSKRRRIALNASLFTIACSLPFALHANVQAVAETNHTPPVVTVVPTTSSRRSTTALLRSNDRPAKSRSRKNSVGENTVSRYAKSASAFRSDDRRRTSAPSARSNANSLGGSCPSTVRAGRHRSASRARCGVAARTLVRTSPLLPVLLSWQQAAGLSRSLVGVTPTETRLRSLTQTAIKPGTPTCRRLKSPAERFSRARSLGTSAVPETASARTCTSSFTPAAETPPTPLPGYVNKAPSRAFPRGRSATAAA